MVGGVHLRKDAESKPPRIVLAIDQAEELFLAEGAAEADAFLRLVRDLAADPASNLIVIATIRSDGYERLQTAAALEGIRQETFSLPPLPKGAYQTVIEGPAARLADTDRPLKVEPALTAALLRDVEEGGAKDALPLLAFTLERLYLEHGGDGDLSLSEYRQLGGIKGSIDAAVEGALRAADTDPAVPRDRAARESLLRRALIPWLAGIDPETGAPRRRVARLGEIPEEARPLVAHLITARLLATDRNPDTGETTVEPAHEALLRQWGLLQGWLEEDFAALSTLEGVKRAARDWEANARLPDWLSHAAGRLDDAEALLARDDFAASLDPSDRAYLAAARAADTARRDRELEEARKLAAAERNAAESARDAADKQRTVANRTRLGLLAASLLAILAAGAAWYGFDQAQKADEQASIASEQARIAEDERVRAEEQAAAAHSALARMLIERTWSTVTRRRDLASRYALTGTSSAGNETVARAALARVMERGAIVARIKVHARQILLASYDPSGDRLVTVDETGETAVTDLTARSVAWRIRPDSQTVSANFSPDGAFVVTVQQDGEISYHHAASGESLMALEAPSEVATAKFSPDGRRLVTSGRDGSALLWDTFSGALLVSLNGHRAPLTDATFSPDGRVILTASIDGTAVLWGADDGELIARLRGHEVAIRTAAFSPDGSTILTASQDDTAIIWDRASGREIRRIQSQWALDSVSFNDDGSSILANDIAGNFMEWSVDGGTLLRAFDGQLAGVEKGMFMQNGHVFAGSGGVTSIIWESASARTIGELSHGGFGGRVLAFNGARNSVVIGLQNGSLLVWDFSQALESISELAASACDGLKANERKFSEFDVAADPLIREVWTHTDASRPVCPDPVLPSAQ